MAGTAEHSVRTLAPFLVTAHPARLLLAAMVILAVGALHNFRVHGNLLISLTVMLMPFALISIERLQIDIVLFTRTAVRVLFAACVVQVLLPRLSNILFAPFIDGFLTFDHRFARATALSMEPSFAAEALFAIAMIHFFFAPRFWSVTTVLILGALSLVRAGTTVQQALLFALVYLFLRVVHLLRIPRPAAFHAGLLPALAACVFALSAMMFGYSLFTYGRLDFSFVRDSMDRFNSWRTLSNYAAYLHASPLDFFPYDSNDGWRQAISGILRAHGMTGDGWVTQPFSAIGVAFLDLGVAGAAAWVTLLFAAAVRRMRSYALDSVQVTILYTLLINGVFLAPKWQLSGFLAIGLIATAIEQSRRRRAGRPVAGDWPTANPSN